MRTAGFLVVLTVCLSATFARKLPCSVPQQFTTRILQAQLSGKCSVYADAGELFYDYPGQVRTFNIFSPAVRVVGSLLLYPFVVLQSDPSPLQRSRVDLSGVFGGTPMNITVLDFYNKKIGYTINQNTNKCTSRTLSFLSIQLFFLSPAPLVNLTVCRYP